MHGLNSGVCQPAWIHLSSNESYMTEAISDYAGQSVRHVKKDRIRKIGCILDKGQLDRNGKLVIRLVDAMCKFSNT